MIHRTIIILVFIFTLNYNTFSQEITDTIAVLENATDILVTRQEGVTKVKANTKDEEGFNNPFNYMVKVEVNDSIDEIELEDSWVFNPPFVRKNNPIFANRNKVRRDVVCFEHLYSGWRFNYSKNKVKDFFEIGIRQLVGIEWSKGQRYKSTFLLGFGMGCKIFKTQDGFAYGKDEDRLTILPVAYGQTVNSSQMTILSFQVPMLYKQNIRNNFNFSIGGIINFNSYAIALTEIKENNLKIKTKYKGFQQNLITPEAYAFFGVWDIGIYFTWSPLSLFHKDYGPELKSLSLGIEIYSF
ncbi:MAG: hypothetical protein HDR88_02970 [Bacteroides sp.]|nr:hypothetical protein [Bacteroides sp.]